MPEPSADDRRAQRVRSLTITVLFTTFIALVVFVVGSEFFLVPRELMHQRQIARLDARVIALEAETAALEKKLATPPPATAALTPAPPTPVRSP